MPGGMMQLVAVGPQDIYFTNNPQITFFKSVFKRHTKFSINTVENSFPSIPTFNTKSSIIIPKSGDLIVGMTLKLTLPALKATDGNKVAWCRRIGYAIINNVEVEIGGTKIDIQYGRWMNIWNQLSRKSNHDRNFKKLIGDDPIINKLSNNIPEYTIYIPLNFWFCQYSGLGLPMIALHHHKLVFSLSLNKSNNLIVYTGNRPFIPNLVGGVLLVDFIYLDTDERRRFATMKHEYLIHQIQYFGNEVIKNKNHSFKLGFHHPIKELFWTITNGDFMSNKNFYHILKMIIGKQQ